MRVGSSFCRFSGNTPAVYGNSPGTFSVSCQRRMSPQSLYSGKEILGILSLESDLLLSGCRISFPRTRYTSSPDSYLFLVSGQFRSEEHTSELQSLMRISYAVFCLKKKKKTNTKQCY